MAHSSITTIQKSNFKITMRFIKIKFNEANTQLIANSIFGTTEVLNQTDEVNNHYKIVKHFLPGFNKNVKYRGFNPFPYFNCNFRLKGHGRAIKIIENKQEIIDDYTEITPDDIQAEKLISADYSKIFKHQIPYGMFFIYKHKDVFYMIATTGDNRTIVISKSKTIEDIFNGKPLEKSVFNFHPLSEQGVKYIYYDNKIVGVLYGIRKI